MTDMQTCAACDHIGLDVRRTFVELEPPWRMVHDPVSDQPVPEHYAVEPRCTDPEACRSRQERTP